MRRQTCIPVRFPLFGLWNLFVPYPSFIHTAYRVPLRSHAAGCHQRFSRRVNGVIGITVGCLSTGCFQQIVYTPLLISEFLGQISSWALHHLTYQALAHSLSYDFCFFTKKVRHLLFFLPLFFWFSYILASSSLTEPQNPSQSSACEGSRGHSVIFLVSRRVVNTSFSWKSVVCLEHSLCIFWRHIILNFNSCVFTSCVHAQLFMNPHIKHVYSCLCTHTYCCHCENRVQSECSFSEQAHQPVKSTHFILTKTRKISFIINQISLIVLFFLL